MGGQLFSAESLFFFSSDVPKGKRGRPSFYVAGCVLCKTGGSLKMRRMASPFRRVSEATQAKKTALRQIMRANRA